MAQPLALKLIDISGVSEDPLKLGEVAKLVREQCVTTGFFMLKMPDGMQPLVKSVLESARQFFMLPENEKQKLNNSVLSQMRFNGQSISGTGSGYRGVSNDPNFKSDTRESFNMGPDVNESEIISGGYSGSGLTPWPNEGLLPGWKSVMQQYSDSLLSSVVPALKKVFAVSLGLEKDYFDQPGQFDKHTWLLGLTHYFPKKSDPLSDVYGIKPHCDSGMFALLFGDGKPGLQICLDKSAEACEREWVDVQIPTEGQLIVNIGQVLERWSGGLYKATMHRVVLDGTVDRLSVPFFYDPNIDLIIKPLTAIEASPRETYKPETPGQMMLDRLHKSNEDFE